MTKITIEITGEKEIARIDALRGKMAARDFILKALEAGLKLAEQQQADTIRFSSAKLEFKTLDVSVITEALKAKDPKNPVIIEIGRLVTAYTAELREHSKKNGNRLPTQLKVQTPAAIERVAFQITADAINKAVKAANKKVAAK